MIKTTLKEIRNTNAINATAFSFEECQSLHSKLECIAYSMGVYGCNGSLYRHRETGELYKVTARTLALFVLG